MGQADVLAASVDSGRMQDADDKERERRMGKEDQPDLEQQTSRARRLGLLLAAAHRRAGDRLSHPGGVAVHGLLLENVDGTVTVFLDVAGYGAGARRKSRAPDAALHMNRSGIQPAARAATVPVIFSPTVSRSGIAVGESP